MVLRMQERDVEMGPRTGPFRPVQYRFELLHASFVPFGHDPAAKTF